ncbi:MAG: HAD family hydrolase, partial [Candidatus Paceibacterales bacterium]
MNSKIKAIIFDLDGLLIDSEPIWNKAYERFLKKKNLVDKPEISEKFMGRGIKEIIDLMRIHFGLTGEVDDLAKQYRDNFYESLFLPGNLRLMEGARDLLERLNKDNKYALAIATSGHKAEMASKILGLLGVKGYFQQIISGDDVTRGKPEPDVYEETARKLGASVSACLVLEDSVNGARSGKAAGMRVIGVNADDKLRQQ